MNSDTVAYFENIGVIVFVVGIFSLIGVTIYYGMKSSIRRKLTQKEFNKAIALVAITSFIAGAGGFPVSLATIDESTSLFLQWLLTMLSCSGCLVIWPLSMVVVFIRGYRRRNLVQEEK